MSTTFRAAVVRTPGGPDSIEIIDVPAVEPGPGQVRVEIAGAAVNPVDLAVAAGVFHGLGLVHQPDHTGLGWDFAGTVIAAGPGVDLAVGSRVAGLVDGFDRDFGTYAEQLVVAGDRHRPRARRSRPDHGSHRPAQRPGRGPAGRPARRRRRPEPARDRGRRRASEGTSSRSPRTAAGGSPDWPEPTDEKFVRGLGADFTTEAAPGWDAVADGAVLQERGVALVRDGGLFVGVQPGAAPAEERGVTVRVVGDPPRRCPARPAPRRRRERAPAGAGARRRTARPGRRRPPRGREGRRAREVRPSALSSPAVLHGKGVETEVFTKVGSARGEGGGAGRRGGRADRRPRAGRARVRRGGAREQGDSRRQGAELARAGLRGRRSRRLAGRARLSLLSGLLSTRP